MMWVKMEKILEFNKGFEHGTIVPKQTFIEMEEDFIGLQFNMEDQKGATQKVHEKTNVVETSLSYVNEKTKLFQNHVIVSLAW